MSQSLSIILHTNILKQDDSSNLFAAESRIIGGSNAQWGGYYGYGQISLQDRNGLHQCGGSLVTKEFIVTSAHCNNEFNRIEVNRYNFNDNRENTLLIRDYEVNVHPQYNTNNNRFDVMLIQLELDDNDQDVLEGILSEQENPFVRLNDNPNFPINNQDLAVIGWGVTEDDEYPPILQEVDVAYIPNQVCRTIRDSKGFMLGNWITPDSMCAGSNGKDACQGDSGSPLIAFDEQEHVLVGIVSWGLECAGPIPGVYHRISRTYSWLQSTICQNSIDDDVIPEYLKCNTPAPTDVVPTNESTPRPTLRPTPAPTPKPSTQPTPESSVFLTMIPQVSHSQDSNDIHDNDNNQNLLHGNPNCTYTTLITTGDEIDVGFHIVIEHLQEQDVAEQRSSSSATENNGLFLVQGVTGNFELFRGKPTNPIRRIWESGFTNGQVDRTYYTTLNQNGNLITSRIHPTSGLPIIEWTNNSTFKGGPNGTYVFALEDCHDVNNDNNNIVVILEENDSDEDVSEGGSSPSQDFDFSQIESSNGLSHVAFSAWKITSPVAATVIVLAVCFPYF